MTRFRILLLLTVLVALSLTSTPRTSQTWKVESVYTLPTVTLSSFLNDHLGISVDDHDINLGGLGSDLWRHPSDGPGIMWLITDRGPNGENPRTFPVEQFTPFILKVKLIDGAIEMLEALPITDSGGDPVTGISNLPVLDETPFDCRGEVELDFNPEGLDTEGLARLRDGTFWVAEEYSPSLLHIGANGRVMARFVPAGLNLGSVDYPVFGTLPGIYSKRRGNRGFEGVALSPDQQTLFAVLQSPLRHPTTPIGNASRNTRILAVDVESGEPVAEYVYRFQPATEFNAAPGDMKISALSMLDARRMLVLERTDDIARIYLVDVKGATDILGGPFDSPATSPSLEALDEAGLVAAGLQVLPKTFVLELDSADGFPKKIEGMTVLDGRTIAIANDNDFGVGSFFKPPATTVCTLNDTGTPSTVQIIRLDQPIK